MERRARDAPDQALGRREALQNLMARDGRSQKRLVRREATEPWERGGDRPKSEDQPPAKQVRLIAVDDDVDRWADWVAMGVCVPVGYGRKPGGWT